MVLLIEFVLCFQPVFQRVSAVHSAVAFVDAVRTPLDFIQIVGVLGLGGILGIAQGERGLEKFRTYDFVYFLHTRPSFCTA